MVRFDAEVDEKVPPLASRIASPAAVDDVLRATEMLPPARRLTTPEALRLVSAKPSVSPPPVSSVIEPSDPASAPIAFPVLVSVKAASPNANSPATWIAPDCVTGAPAPFAVSVTLPVPLPALIPSTLKPLSSRKRTSPLPLLLNDTAVTLWLALLSPIAPDVVDAVTVPAVITPAPLIAAVLATVRLPAPRLIVRMLRERLSATLTPPPLPEATRPAKVFPAFVSVTLPVVVVTSRSAVPTVIAPVCVTFPAPVKRNAPLLPVATPLTLKPLVSRKAAVPLPPAPLVVS